MKIAVPENEVATLGDQAAMIKVAALGGQCFEGKVTEKGIVANPISHTYEAKIRLENPSGALLPGMVCDVRLSGEESVPAIALPNNAVLIANDGGRFRLEGRRRKGESYARTDGRLDGARLVYSGRVERGGYRRDRRLPENQ